MWDPMCLGQNMMASSCPENPHCHCHHLGTNFLIPFWDFKSLALCPSPKPCCVTVSSLAPPPSACHLDPTTRPPPVSHPFPQPSHFPWPGFMSCRAGLILLRGPQRGWGGKEQLKFSASGRQNYLPDRLGEPFGIIKKQQIKLRAQGG